MTDKRKFPRGAALAVAAQICRALEPHCERLIVAGSLRRRKELVGDVEILFIGKTLSGPNTEDMFGPPVLTDLADVAILEMLKTRVIDQRRNINGSVAWGAKNRLAVHRATGIPVDLFKATAENWFNYLVCRTGSAANNERICMAAINRRWKWNPYGAGFTDNHGEIVPVKSERDAFALVGLTYLEPWDR